jgi:hypothetical protein
MSSGRERLEEYDAERKREEAGEFQEETGTEAPGGARLRNSRTL